MDCLFFYMQKIKATLVVGIGCLQDRTVKLNSALGSGVKFLKKLYRGVGGATFAEKISKINQCSK